MARLKLQHRRYWAGVRVPKALQDAYAGKEHLWRNLQTSDIGVAKVEAAAWEAMLRLEWQEKAKHPEDGPRALRQIYADLRRRAVAGEFTVDTPGEDPVEAGIVYAAERITEGKEDDELSPADSIRLAALVDAQVELSGQKVRRRKELEPAFSEVAEDFMVQWRTQRSLKETNTEQQKEATFKLFAGFWQDKAIRGVGIADAASFHDALRRTDPSWARSKTAKEMTWATIQQKFGGKAQGLSDATMNRHMAALKSLWDWAARRGHCAGHNPFDGFHRKLQQGRNVDGYVAWETDELNKLFKIPPKRIDLREVIVVGMFTGMRLDEIASLRWNQIRKDEGVSYIQVLDAKTPAGKRQIPLHDSLSWLRVRAEGKREGRIWTTFNPEGPGKKAGADAGKEFSRFKAARGFTSRTKAFHSFRKNVTRIMERAGVHENEWAQIFGHEKGFTYRRYNPDGITLARKQEIIDLIVYPAVTLADLTGKYA
jgi:integrase